MVKASQSPTVEWSPTTAVSSLGPEAIELAESCGLSPDLWQRDGITKALGVRGDGKFAAFEVGVNVPRQNGKGGLLELRELASVELLGDRLVIHSAHEFATSMTAMNRMESLLEEGGLHRKLKKRGGVSRSHGDEGFKFQSGQRIWYRTRTKGGGRGYTADLVVLDEAMILQEMFIAALFSTMSARSMIANPQLWYTGSAVDQLSMEHGLVFARLRQRGHAGGDPSLLWLEWAGADAAREDGRPVTPDDFTTAELSETWRWYQANPALGVRISEEFVENELRSMDARTFAVERLGIGDWPRVVVNDGAISFDDWVALEDEGSSISGDLCLAFDVRPDRAKAAIVAVGFRPDGRLHVEVIDHRAGTNWVVPRLVELRDKHHPRLILRTSHGPVASLKNQIAASRLDVTEVSSTELGEACGRFADQVSDAGVRHLGQPELASAVKGAKTRPLGDAWAWSRKLSTSDISPLVAATIGAWVAEQRLTSVYAERGMLTV